jgi:hypothetical protein
MESLAEAWPGTPEYKKKFGSPSADGPDGSRHKIDRTPGITRATRKYDAESGESEEPTKSREDAAAAPAKRGRGRPPGKYGSYKKKVKESLEILESLETEEEIEEFVFSLDEESFAELEQYLSEEQGVAEGEEQIDELRNVTQDQLGGRMSSTTRLFNKTPAGKEREVKRRQEHLKGQMKFTKSQGGIAGPKGKLPEEVEQTDEAMSQQAKTTMKHVKNATPGEKKAAKDIKPGIAGYRDRIAMLHSAKNRGALKEEEVDESSNITHIVAKKNLQKHKDWMESEGFDTKTRALPKNHPKHSTHVGIVAKNSQEAGYHEHGHASPIKEETVGEALKHPNHKVLDKNKNNKLDKEDFAILRGEKKAPMKEEVSEDQVANIAAFITKQSKGEA